MQALSGSSKESSKELAPKGNESSRGEKATSSKRRLSNQGQVVAKLQRLAAADTWAAGGKEKRKKTTATPLNQKKSR